MLGVQRQTSCPFQPAEHSPVYERIRERDGEEKEGDTMYMYVDIYSHHTLTSMYVYSQYLIKDGHEGHE